LLAELLCILRTGGVSGAVGVTVGPHAIGRALFGPYVMGVELSSILLMAGLVGAYHLARPAMSESEGEGP
jgi:NADH-quinone oxidoreductase subunit J